MVIAAVMPERDVEKVSGITTSYSAYLSRSDVLIPPTTRMERVGYVYIDLWSLYYIEGREYVLRNYFRLMLTRYANAAVNPPMAQGESHGEVAQGRNKAEALFEYKPWAGYVGFEINIIVIGARYRLTDDGEAVGIESIMWGPPNRSMLTTPAVIV